MIEQQTGFIYIWRDRKTKMYCIGSHYGPEDDGYITSTGYMPSAYKKRPQDFKRRILYRHYADRDGLLVMENYYLSMIKESELHPTKGYNKRPPSVRYYNMKRVAMGQDPIVQSKLKHSYWNDPVHGPERKELQAERMKG